MIRLAIAGLSLALLAVGESLAGGSAGFALDRGFGEGGRVRASFFGPDSEGVLDVAVLPDGRYYALGGSLERGYLSRHLASGALDAGFGHGGSITVDGFVPAKLALQANGRIVVVGTTRGGSASQDFVVSRFLDTGAVDAGFGQGGRTVTDFHGNLDVARAVVIAGDGSIVLAGSAFMPNYGLAGVGLARYSGSGSLVAKRATKLFADTGDGLHDLLLLSDGRLLGIGVSSTPALDVSIVARFHVDLTLDSGFGSNGITALFPGSRSNLANAGSRAGNGDIVVVGEIALPGGASNMLLARLDAQGALIPGFGNGGWTEIAVPGDDTVRGSDVLVDGERIFVGIGTLLRKDFVVARFTAAGALDPGFGTGGLRIVDFNQGVDELEALALHQGGLLAAGSVRSADAEQQQDFGFSRMGQDGQPDGSFGSGGRVEIGFSGAPMADRARAMAVQNDGRILMLGYAQAGARDFAITRHLDNGEPDASFGEQGRVRLDFASGNDDPWSILVQPDGRILASGNVRDGNSSRFGVLRLLADGSRDPTFGDDGMQMIDVGHSPSDPVLLALQADGRIVVAGSALVPPQQSYNFVVLRLTATGQTDQSFGDNGKVTVAMTAGRDFVTAINLPSDGTILVAGSGGNPANFQVLRLLANGTPDPGFGVDGKVAVDFFGRDDYAVAMAVIGSGASERIYLAGQARLGASVLSAEVALAALDASGDLDPAFGEGGKAVVALTETIDQASAVIVDANGLVVACHSQIDNGDFVLLGLGFDGEPDPGFSPGGARMAIDFDGYTDQATALAWDDQQRLLVAGWTHDGSPGVGGQDFALIRLAPVPDALFDNGFEAR